MKARLLTPVVLLALAAAAPTQAAIGQLFATLDGASEAPSNGSPGTGLATITIDTTLRTMRVEVSFSGLVGNVTASHIHAATAVAGTGTAGVATTTPTFFGFPSGVTAGSYDNTLDMTLASSYNPSYVAAHGASTTTAFNDLLAAMTAGKSYLNIHTTSFPGGEIRGFLVPAPGAAALLGLSGLAALRRRR